MELLKVNNRENFDKLADCILNDIALVINDKEYSICDIEFYMYNSSHPDRYTSRDERQLRDGELIFYENRLEITLGDRDTYFGILIRSLLETDTGVMYSADKLLDQQVIDSLNYKLVAKATQKRANIAIGPRIGLSDKCPYYKDCKYRYYRGSTPPP